MQKTDNLFELIRSLDNNEKRYFSLYAERHTIGEKNNYLKLFELIASQKEYDEENIISQLSDNADKRNFQSGKHYLYKLILKSMRSYRSGISVDMQLKELLIDIEFLFDKGLYLQCNKLVASGEKLSEEYEEHWYIAKLLHWKVELMRIQSYTNISVQDVEAVFNKMSDAAKRQDNENSYNRLSSLFSIYVKKQGNTRTEKDLIPYQNIMDEKLLCNESEALSYHSLYFFYACHSMNCFARNNIQNGYDYANKLVNLLETNPRQTEKDPIMYARALYQLGICQGRLKKYNAIFVVINKLKDIHTKKEKTNKQIMFFYSDIELNICIDTGNFENGIKVIENIEHEMKKSEELKKIFFKNKQIEVTLYYNFACVYFGAENYDKANYWLNKIINDSTLDLRNDLVCFARILHLVIHFEKHNEDLIEYRVKSANRFLQKKERLYPFEKLILEFFEKKLPNSHTHKEMVNIFMQLKADIYKILKNSTEKNILEYFDFISWIDSKIEGKTFAEVVKGKLVKSS